MAKRFQFRLETVAKLRRRRQDECRRVVAERVRQITAQQARIDGLGGQLDQTRGSLRGLAAPGDESAQVGLDLTGLRRHRHYANCLQQWIADAGQALVELNGHLATEQSALAQAAREVKALEKLEQKQRARYELTLARAERAEADETAAQLFRRRRVADSMALELERSS